MRTYGRGAAGRPARTTSSSSASQASRLSKSLDAAIHLGGQSQQLLQALMPEATECGLAVGLATLGFRGLLAAFPGGTAAPDTQQATELLGERPQHDGRLGALGTQSRERAHRSGAIALERAIAEIVDRVARRVVHQRRQRGGVQRTGFRQQRQLVDLLARGEQVAFDALGQQRHRVGAGLESRGAQALADPARQFVAPERPGPDRGAGLVQGAEPRGFFHVAVELAAEHQHHVVGCRLRRELAQHRAALGAQLGAGEAHLDQLAVAEQRQTAALRAEAAPVEAGVHVEHLPLPDAAVAAGRTQRVGAFLHQQRLVAEEQVERKQPRLEPGGEILDADTHGGA